MTNSFNYFNNGVAITKSQFESVIPSDWQNNLNEYGEYSYGYFRAVLYGSDSWKLDLKIGDIQSYIED
jgi:hypothetical protein